MHYQGIVVIVFLCVFGALLSAQMHWKSFPLAVGDSGKLLPCVEEIRALLQDHGAQFDSLAFALLENLLNSLTEEQQERFYRQPQEVKEGYYIRSPQELRRRFQGNECTKDLKVAICVQQHSNGQFMQEWIAHYLLLGATKVIIYDNSKPGSSESRYFRAVVEPFVSEGYVDIVHWYFDSGQDTFKPAEAFQDCFERYHLKYDWIGNFDSDEFLIIQPPSPSCLPDTLRSYMEFGGLVVNWRLMSPVGPVVRNSSKLLLDQFLWTLNDGQKHVKTIYQTKFTRKIANAHCAEYVPGLFAVSPDKSPVACPFNNATSTDDLYNLLELRHFYGRDMMFFLFDKICSRTVPGQITYRSARVRMLIALITTKYLRRVQVPRTEKLRSLLFGDS